MDIQIQVEPTYEEFSHLHMLMQGRSRGFQYAIPVTQLMMFLLTIVIAVLVSFDGLSIAEFMLLFLFFLMQASVVFVQYILQPRMIRKHFLQLQNLGGSQAFRFTDEGVACKDQAKESHLPWGKYIKWLEDDVVLVLFQTDVLIHLIPKRCLTLHQAEEIRRAVREAGIPVHKIRRAGNIVWMAAVWVVMAPVICLATVLTLLSLL
jgi:hypothetical protein